MKFLTTLIAALSAPDNEASVRALVRLVAVLVVSVVAFSLGFQGLMAHEGREFSWWSAVYWTVVTMSTLGYGDITFNSDIGQMYSLVVLFAGAILILVMLPFTFIQVVYLPWRAATRRASAPRSLPESISDHVIVTQLDHVGEALVERLSASGVPYAILVDDVEEGLALHDRDFSVAVGAYDDPETYRRIRASRATMVFTSRPDVTNTNIAYTLREVTDAPTVVATAMDEDSVDILELAGCDRVLQLGELLGGAFGRKILAPTAQASEVARFEDLVIAEASASGTELVGRSLRELGLRSRFGVTVVALWDRGNLQMATADMSIADTTVLLLAGTEDEIDAYNEALTAPEPGSGSTDDERLILIIGGGRVGRATAAAVAEAGFNYRIVERNHDRVPEDDDRYIVGDAADRETLSRAGVEEASTIVITTHDDDTNLFLTLYCRKLRPEVQILGRVTLDRNLHTMHRAGADFVLSYASAGAAEAWNTVREESTVLLAEGLVLFRATVPDELAGRSLRETHVPRETGCHVMAVGSGGHVETSVDLDEPLPAGADIILIGTEEAEERFLRRYVARRRRSWLRRG
ncbi:MAG: NAD-binding protein [Nitriliruptorales bacterium]|nr:NAD-binding protein [Nitriliruptorales bacterium]